MKPQRHKSVSIAIATVYSLILHAVVLGSVLAMPIYGGGEKHIDSYQVYLQKALPETSTEERTPAKKTLEEASKTPKAERTAAAPEIPKKSLKKSEGGKKAGGAPSKSALKVREKKLPEPKTELAAKTKERSEPEEEEPDKPREEPKVIKANRTAVQEPEPLIPDRKTEPVKEADEESSPRIARRFERPVADKAPEKTPREVPKEVPAKALEKSTEPSAKFSDEEKKESVKESVKESFDKPGWQEPVEPEEKELITDTKESRPKEGPTLLGAGDVISSRLYEYSARKVLRQQEPEVPVVPAKTNTPDVLPPAGDICEDCGMVSKLYKNSLLNIVDERETAAEVLKEEKASDVSLPLETICKDCGIVSSEYQNLAKDMMSYRAGEETSSGLMQGDERGSDSDSEIDLLCVGCLMVAMLDENPGEGIIYDDSSQAQIREEEGFLSVIDEFCGECVRTFQSPAEVKYAIWDSSAVEVVESVEVIAPSQDEEKPGSLVMEVPDEELVPMAPSVSIAAAKDQSDIIAETDMGNPVAEILTPSANRTPSIEDYLAGLDKDLHTPEEPEPPPDEGGGPGLPLYGPRDMEIRVFFDGSAEGVSFKLMRKPHPMGGGGDRAAEITGETEELVTTEDAGLQRIFSLAKAEKGVYMFIIRSEGSDVSNLKVRFLLYRDLVSERAKDYDGITLMNGAELKIMFLMPEAIFWDDEDYFTGEIEGPNSVTKFNGETGLVWKEKSGGY